MSLYNPDKFASLYETELGQRIWDFLNQSDNIARLETASQLSKPAVKGIEDKLLEEFRKDILNNRVKQMVGHMVRQVLEQHGWVLDQTDVKVASVLFSKAARYRRPDWITFHAFRNTSDPRDVAITNRRQNAKLPEDAHWSYYAIFASPLQASVVFDVSDIRQLREHVNAHGFYRKRIERILRPA